MPEVIQLGPLMLKLDLLIWAVSGGAGYYVVKNRVKKAGIADTSLFDLLPTALMLVIFVWKFSPLLFSPAVWKNPLTVLFASGSTKGLWLGLAIAGLYLSLKSRNKPNAWVLPDVITYGVVAMLMVYSLLSWRYGASTGLPWGISIRDPAFKYHPINVYRLIVLIPLLIWLWRRPLSRIGSGKLTADVLTYLGIGMLLVSFFENRTSSLILSGEQMMFLVMSMCGVVLQFLKARRT